MKLISSYCNLTISRYPLASLLRSSDVNPFNSTSDPAESHMHFVHRAEFALSTSIPLTLKEQKHGSFDRWSWMFPVLNTLNIYRPSDGIVALHGLYNPREEAAIRFMWIYFGFLLIATLEKRSVDSYAHKSLYVILF